MKLLKANLNAQTPVIMLTANAIVGAKEEYLQEGFTGYLAKPVREADLLEVLRKYLPSDTEQAPLLDEALGMEYCGNDRKLYREVLRDYTEEDKRSALQKFFAAQDWENYKIVIHAVKSASLSIGAKELSEHAKALEMAAKSEDWDYIRQHHAQLLAEYGTVIAFIREKY
jgi:HPt (histidine-containing phosphotransfer) domain-containing protein